ncbi:MAG TPA: tryptophan 7-halogenase, partial [Dehalococcoidia bacterium]|nr:tryptophan 7-halogenase [Dehalococcoidia bacterium]
DADFQNLAVYSYYAGAERLPAPDETNILIESYEHGWLWLIPLHNGLMSVGAVVDQRRGGEALRTLGAADFLERQIAQAAHARAMLRAAQPTRPAVVVRDWSYSSRELSGDGWALAGDAACFIDPLFSTGVHLALSAGVLAAALAETALKDPALARAAAPVYHELYESQYSLFRQLVRLFYATNRSIDSYFWEARRIVGDESLAPRSAFVRAVAGRPPAGYERAVLERGELPEALAAGMQAVAGERERRRQRFAALVETGAVEAAVPALSAGARVERRPALGEGEFVPGFALLRPGVEPVDLSPFVAVLLSHVDGSRTVGDVLMLLAAQAQAEPAAITGPALQALDTLYADGALELTVPAGVVASQ